MTQRHIPTPPGHFAACPSCGHQPRHIETRGRSRRETMAWAVICLRHSLECRCGRTTALHATVQAAEAEWGFLDVQIPLALPPAVTRLHPRRLTRQAVRS